MSGDLVDKMVHYDSADAGEAVGVSKKHWFVAIVSNNTEKYYGEKLKKMGYESYVPIQKEMHHWRNGKVKTIDRIIIPMVIFVHVTEIERKKEVVTLPFIKCFMADKARKGSELWQHPVATIPNEQIEQLRFMLENADTPVGIEPMPIHVGDKIRVKSGNLQGLEGNIIHCNEGASFIVVRLESLGCAKMRITSDQVESISNSDES